MLSLACPPQELSRARCTALRIMTFAGQRCSINVADAAWLPYPGICVCCPGQVLRLLENEQVAAEEVETALHDGLEYYLEAATEPDFQQARSLCISQPTRSFSAVSLPAGVPALNIIVAGHQLRHPTPLPPAPDLAVIGAMHLKGAGGPQKKHRELSYGAGRQRPLWHAAAVGGGRKHWQDRAACREEGRCSRQLRGDAISCQHFTMPCNHWQLAQMFT